MLARKTLIHFLNTVLGGLFGVVALKLVAQFMGDSILGQVAYAMGLLSLLRGFTLLKLGKAHRKRMAEGERMGDCMTTFLWAQTGATILFLTIIAIGLTVWTGLLGKQFQSTTLLVIVVMALYFSVRNMRLFAESSFEARGEIARSQAIDIVDNFARTGTAALLALVYAAAANSTGPLADVVGLRGGLVEAYGAELLALTYVVGSLAAVLASLYYLVGDYPWGSFDLDLLKAYWAFAKPLVVVGVISSMTDPLDRVTLGYFWTDSQVGIYFGADRVVGFMRNLSLSLATVLMPAVSSMAARGDHESIGKMTSRSVRYTSLVILPMVAFVIVFARPIIHLLLADSFLKGAPTLMALAVHTYLFVVFQPYTSSITGMDRTDLTARVMFAMAATNVVLNLILVPKDIQLLGIQLLGLKSLGAALATLASGLVGFLYYRYIAGQLLELPSVRSNVARQMLAAGAMVGLLALMRAELVGLARWYHLILFSLVGGLGYLVALVALREFDRDDLEFFLELANPVALWEHLKEALSRSED